MCKELEIEKGKSQTMDVSTLKEQGNNFIQLQKFAEAIKCFTAALEIDPYNPVLYSNRSAAYSCLKEWRLALSDSDQAIRCKPDWGKAYSRKGVAAFQLEKYEQAIFAYEQAKLFEPKVPSHEENLRLAKSALLAAQYHTLGEEKFLKDDFQLAIDWWNKAIELHATALYFSHRSKAHHSLTNYDSALSDAENAILLRPDWDKGYRRKAEALLAKNMKEEANKILAKAEAVANKK